MIIDSFIFFNELDVLDIRLHELDSVVDMFLLVESPITFSGKPKPLHFEENKYRFAPFLPKIKHLVVEDMPEGSDPWKREMHQRKCIIDRGLLHLPELAIAMISDVDEFPSADSVAELPKKLQEVKEAITFKHFFCNYFVNRVYSEDGDINKIAFSEGTRAAQVHAWKGLGGRETPSNVIFSGWHLSFLGGLESIKYKLDSYSHHADEDHQNLHSDKIMNLINSGKVLASAARPDEFVSKMKTIELDEIYWPSYIRQNKHKFSHLIA